MTDERSTVRKIHPSNVESLNRSTGELVFRFTLDERVALHEVVEHEGVGFVVLEVGALSSLDGAGYLGARAKVVEIHDLLATPFALTLKQGDVVVLQADARLSQDQLLELKSRASEAFVGFPVVVLDQGVKVGKVTS